MTIFQYQKCAHGHDYGTCHICEGAGEMRKGDGNFVEKLGGEITPTGRPPSGPMTDKLVARLRHEARLRAHYGDPILEEAADEIERLREVIQGSAKRGIDFSCCANAGDVQFASERISELESRVKELEEENAHLQRCSWEGR